MNRKLLEKIENLCQKAETLENQLYEDTGGYISDRKIYDLISKLIDCNLEVYNEVESDNLEDRAEKIYKELVNLVNGYYEEKPEIKCKLCNLRQGQKFIYRDTIMMRLPENVTCFGETANVINIETGTLEKMSLDTEIDINIF